MRAQYPDSGGPPGQPPVVSSLGSLIRLRRQIDRDPNAAARQREIGREAARALLSTAGIDARQSGSIVLLMVGIGVLSVGGVLRWHRGRANI